MPSLGLNQQHSKQSESLEFFLKKKKSNAPLPSDRNRMYTGRNELCGGFSTENDMVSGQNSSMMIVERQPYSNESASKNFSFNIKNRGPNLLRNRRNFFVSTDNFKSPRTGGDDSKHQGSPEGAKGRLPPMKQFGAKSPLGPPMTARSNVTTAYRQFRFSVDLVPTDVPQTARESDGPRIVVDDPTRNSAVESKQLPAQTKRRILAIG